MANDITSIILWSLAEGAGYTIVVSAISLILGFFLAVLLAIILVSKSKLYGIRYVAQIYVDFFRSTPLLVQILIFYVGLPSIVPNYIHIINSISAIFPLINDGLISGIIALTLNTAAYQAEIIRSGILGIPAGQTEAARALGMTPKQTMLHVIIPQAIRMIIPPLTNEIINIILNSSLVSAIGVLDLTKRAQQLQSYYFRWEILFIAAIYYLVISVVLSKIAKKIEEKYRIPGLGVCHD